MQQDMPEVNWSEYLTGHREAEIKWYGSRSYIDKKYADRISKYVSDHRCGLHG